MNICLRCGKIFARRSSLLRHFENKNICDANYIDINYNTIINEYDKYYKKYLKIIKNMINYNDDNGSNDIFYNCEYCGRKLKHRSTYYDHRKNRCEKKKENDQINSELNAKFLQLKMEFAAENQELKDKIKILEDKLDDKRVSNNYNQDSCINNGEQQYINNGNSTNNVTNNDNKIINNGTVIINNYGEEDLSQIGIEDWKALFACEWKMIPKLTEKMHIESEKGRNIYIPSLKDKHLMILKNQKWILVDRKSFIKELIFKKNEIFLEIIDKYKKEFKDVDLKRKIKILNMCLSEDEIDDVEREETISGVQLALYHGKYLVKDSYEKGYNRKLRTGE